MADMTKEEFQELAYLFADALENSLTSVAVTALVTSAIRKDKGEHALKLRNFGIEASQILHEFEDLIYRVYVASGKDFKDKLNTTDRPEIESEWYERTEAEYYHPTPKSCKQQLEEFASFDFNELLRGDDDE